MFTIAQRRARLGRRHHLAAGGATVEQVAGALCGLHATDPASVFLAARARVAGVELAMLEAALYEQRTLLRTLGMRRTMFTIDVAHYPAMHAACTRAVAARERRNLLELIGEGGVGADPASWLAEIEARVLAEVAARQPVTGAQLSAAIPGLGRAVAVGEGKTWAAEIGLSTRVLFLLAADGLLARGRPRGSWTSSQYQWHVLDDWLGTAVDLGQETETAQVELLGRWLATFGPATAKDIQWWTGWTMAQSRRALAAIGASVVELEGGTTGYVLPGDEDEPPADERWVALLPALDPTAMGWNERDWYLGEHRAALFDRSGNIGPTIWSDGRIVGGWSQRRDGTVALAILAEVDPGTRSAIADEALALEAWLAPTIVSPRFPTPLDRQLRA